MTPFTPLLLGATALLAGPCGPPPASPWPRSAAQAAEPSEGRGQDAPARELSRGLCAVPRLAGTSGSERGARYVAEVLEAAGWAVEFDRREVLLSLPRSIALQAHATRPSEPTKEASGEPNLELGERLFERIETFDPDHEAPDDIPKFLAYARSGQVTAAVVDVGRGLRADYERLTAAGTEIAGRIAFARYGGAYRGVKVELAEEFGCVAALLYSPRADEGSDRGSVWPEGPWKPDWAAQRGSILSLARVPGDPSTPGYASEVGGRRSSEAQREAVLPNLPAVPLAVGEAQAILDALAAGDEVHVSLTLDAPRDVRPITNVIARLAGTGERLVLAGNHRDAWVRGAHDAGSGTVSLLRAAQRLGERAAAGWKPQATLVLGFWDAEEFGLIGSTEWAEGHADELRRRAALYVNADAVVSGPRFNASGCPGWLRTLEAVLARVEAPVAGRRDARTLAEAWGEGRDGDEPRELGLPGSGSDFTVFLHHLAIPVLDVSFGGRSGGQYHTRFDDFDLMDRFLDPGFVVHECAGELLAELLATVADAPATSFDAVEAADALGRMVAREADREEPDSAMIEPLESLAEAFARLARSSETALAAGADPAAAPRFYAALEHAPGLPERPWYKNRLWAPGLETGYAAETLPIFRAARARGDERAAQAELEAITAAIDALRAAWEQAGEDARGPDTDRSEGR